MKRHVVVYQDHYSPDQVASYLREARRRYRAALSHENMRRTHAKEPMMGYPYHRHEFALRTLSELYTEYHRSRKILVSYVEFENEVALHLWRPWSYARYSSKYQKLPHHDKKVLTREEESRRAWREHIKFKKDRSKGRDSQRHWNAARKPCRKMEEKQYRQWVRQCIRRADWDAMGDDHIQNKWLWL